MNNCVVFNGISNKVLSNSSMLSGVLSEDGEYYVHVKDSAGNIGISNKVDIQLKLSTVGNYIISNPTNGLNTRIEGGLYRYQGTNVDNYICFGTSDKSTCLGNPDAYMYRIIGITQDGMVKIIKNYALNDKVQWDDYPYDNVLWTSNSLYSQLNGSLFLTNSSYMPSGWSDKVETTTWKYGEFTDPSLTADAMYNKENSWSGRSAKIGLIHAHDYYYAYQSGGLNCSSSANNCRSSWIHLSVCDSGAPSDKEWIIPRYGKVGTTYWAWYIESSGKINYNYSDQDSEFAARPVFYIKSDVSFIGGTGTSINPFIIS